MFLPLITALIATAAATDLLIPLYQYPLNNGAVWKPIEDAMTANPSLIHKIVINPDNGPGGKGFGIEDGWYKNGALNIATHKNAQLLGYVHTSTDGGVTRCNAPLAEVKANITRWSDWVAQGVAVKGIFIDEAPADSKNDCVAYMRELTDFIRNDDTLGFAKPRLVIFNPGGTGALQPYYDLKPTLILALETCFTSAPRGSYDGCFGDGSGYERYDHEGIGSSIDKVLFPNIGKQNAASTAVMVHGFHGSNGPSAGLEATEAVLSSMIQAAVSRKIGALFFNTAWYNQFSDGPADIGTVARLLNAANAGTSSKTFVKVRS
ncbi:Spherulation-specific family 4-domain-containing protein [Podospora didyma]|uniref:Spherulation-specific family 4-domain-containing protein n=1 Tax=Podospora didyma TaxID=330526 RepID=A0AAE0NQK1_9PEZI|nr:Spherulation-specific family 4-domain-containing protein [Podospora didyma]